MVVANTVNVEAVLLLNILPDKISFSSTSWQNLRLVLMGECCDV